MKNQIICFVLFVGLAAYALCFPDRSYHDSFLWASSDVSSASIGKDILQHWGSLLGFIFLWVLFTPPILIFLRPGKNWKRISVYLICALAILPTVYLFCFGLEFQLFEANIHYLPPCYVAYALAAFSVIYIYWLLGRSLVLHYQAKKKRPELLAGTPTVSQ